MQRRPQAWVVAEGEFGAAVEGPQPEFAVGDAIGEAEAGMLDGIEAGERVGRDIGFENVAVGPPLAFRAEHAGADRAGVFAGAVDQELLGDRTVEAVTAAGGQEDEIVAEPAGAVDVVRIASVEPDVQAVAFFDAILAAPREMALAGDAEPKRETSFIPASANLRPFRPAVERCEVRQSIGLAARAAQLGAAFEIQAGHGIPKQEAAGK